jgi:hypothetical protein
LIESEAHTLGKQYWQIHENLKDVKDDLIIFIVRLKGRLVD